MPLDPRFRFDTFVVGAANRLAVSAARAVAQSPGAAYNPLFIYAPSGLGKTHLLAAIGHLAKQLQPDLQVAYVTTDELVEHLHQAVTRGETETFRNRFAQLDMLLLDDVQFLTGRQETQSELLRLFNVLQRSGKQIVLTSDRPPGEIADLDERLMTRFSGGLLVDMGAPDYETRVAILRHKCQERGATFPSGVLEELARGGAGGKQPGEGIDVAVGIHQALEESQPLGWACLEVPPRDILTAEHPQVAQTARQREIPHISAGVCIAASANATDPVEVLSVCEPANREAIPADLLEDLVLAAGDLRFRRRPFAEPCTERVRLYREIQARRILDGTRERNVMVPLATDGQRSGDLVRRPNPWSHPAVSATVLVDREPLMGGIGDDLRLVVGVAVDRPGLGDVRPAVHGHRQTARARRANRD